MKIMFEEKGGSNFTINMKTCQKMIQANLLEYEYLNDI